MSRLQTGPDVTSKSCRRCGNSWPGPTRCGLCYECVLVVQGRKLTELHHPFGRQNENVAAITVEIPGNWHQELDARRAQRPEVLKRPGANPLHQIAAVVATLGEAADVYADFARHQGSPEWEWTAELAETFAHAAYSAATWLLVLAGRLDDRLGPEWVRNLDLPPCDM